MTLKYELQSGKIVEMDLATMPQALSLYRAVIQECKGTGLDISTATDTTLGDMLIKNQEALLNIIGSEIVINAIQNCCEKVLYDGQHYSLDLFENNEKARGDFFGLMLLVASENLRPFFPSLNSVFSMLSGIAIK
jgi:hypothetical protein